MEYWVVALISLLVLYATGSLRRAAKINGISGRAFVIYFAVGLGLALLPLVYILGVGINICGAYLCTAAGIYIGVTRRFDYLFFIAAASALLIGVAHFVVSNSLMFQGVGYISTALIALGAVLIYRGRAALFFPVMALVYNAAIFMVSLALGLSHNHTLFADMELILYGLAGCLLVSYVFERPLGAHARRARS